MPLNPTATRQLLTDLLDGQASALAKPVEQWVVTSKPFAAFAQTHQNKIRKKIRTCRGAEERYNLYCELRTAYVLLQAPNVTLAYEPHAKEAGRSADYGVTFRANTLFHVEVTRLRASSVNAASIYGEGAVSLDGETEADSARRTEIRRLTDVVCDKFGQFAPTTANVLWVWSDSPVMQQIDLGQVMVGLKQRAEQRDPALFARHRFEKPADFIRNYQRLSAILVQNLHPPTSQPTSDRAPRLWQNSDARHPLPTKIANLLAALVAADASPSFA